MNGKLISLTISDSHILYKEPILAFDNSFKKQGCQSIQFKFQNCKSFTEKPLQLSNLNYFLKIF